MHQQPTNIRQMRGNYSLEKGQSLQQMLLEKLDLHM